MYYSAISMRCIILAFICLCLPRINARANVFTVTSNTGNGVGSLPALCASAANGDTIVFDASLNGTTIQLDTTILLNKDLTIIGPGAADLSISVVNDSVTALFTVPADTTLAFSGFTVVCSPVINNFGISYARDLVIDLCDSTAFVSVGKLYLTNCVFNGLGRDHNIQAIKAYNGIVVNLDSVTITNYGNDDHTILDGYGLDTLIMHNCNISNNWVIAGNMIYCRDGGYYNIEDCLFDVDSSVTAGSIVKLIHSQYNSWVEKRTIVKRCTFSNNFAYGPCLAASRANTEFLVEDCLFMGNYGFNSSCALTVTVTRDGYINNCSFINNSSLFYAGALYMQGDTIHVNNCTFTGNETRDVSTASGSSGGGGAICVSGAGTNTGKFYLSNSTVTGNYSADKGGGLLARFYIDVILQNNIIAGNTAPNNQGNDIHIINRFGSSIASRGYNLIGDTTGMGLFTMMPTDICGDISTPVDPLLDSLTFAYSLPVVPLLCGSPAINTGTDTLTVPDELYQPRVGIADRGALEFTHGIIVDTIICPGQSAYGYTATGIYLDTIVPGIGCDGIRTLTLTVHPNDTSIVDTSICMGEMYDGHGTTGIYATTYTNQFGCDSVVVLDLTVNNLTMDTVSTTICFGDTYEGYNASGIYNDTFSTSNCDSIRVLNLNVLAETSQENISICFGDILYGYTQTGVYVDTFTNFLGCDSIRTLILSVDTAALVVIDTAICAGDSILAGGAYQIMTGTYYDTILNTSGCDSLYIETALAVHWPPSSPSVSQDGATLSVPDGYYNYQWYSVNNGALVGPGANYDSVTVLFNDGFYVVVYDTIGCSATSDTVQVTGVGIADVADQLNVQVYPNPNTGIVTLQLSGFQLATFELYNLLGERLMSQPINQPQTELQLHVAEGVYIYHVNIGGQTVAMNRLVVIQ